MVLNDSTERNTENSSDRLNSDFASVIIDGMYQFVALLDNEGRLLEVNRPALEGTGLKLSDIRGEFMWEVPVWKVTQENYQHVKEASLRASNGEFVREELQLFAAASGKEVVTIDFSIKPIKDSLGNIQFLIAEGRNITDRKIAESEVVARVTHLIAERNKAEIALKDSEERYRTLVEATTSAVWTTNPKGEIVLPQVAWIEFTGQSHEESLGLNWINAFHPDDRIKVKNSLLNAISHIQLFEIEGRIWSQQFKMFRHVIARGISLKDTDDSIREWIITLYDVHEKTTMDQRLRNSLKEKESLLKEMHHRVKNNMQVILSLLRLQAKNVGEKKLKSLLEESQNRIRAMALVHERLYRSASLSKIEFSDYITSIANELHTSFTSARVGEINLILKLQKVDIDVTQAVPCGLLINELISNSLKHAFPEGVGGTIIITLEEKSPTKVYLSIEDNGIGMPSEVMLGKVNTLGIQIVKTLANQLGANLVCTSTTGTSWIIEFEREFFDTLNVINEKFRFNELTNN